MEEQPEWRTRDDEEQLVYRGYVLVTARREPPGVRVITRCYSEGFLQNRLLATLGGARRYGDAWLRKWGKDAMRDINNKISWHEGELARRLELEQRRQQGELENSFQVPKYRARKRRR